MSEESVKDIHKHLAGNDKHARQGKINLLASLGIGLIVGTTAAALILAGMLWLNPPAGSVHWRGGLSPLDYTRQLEAKYSRHIEAIVTPIVGNGRVRAQVAVDRDFAAYNGLGRIRHLSAAVVLDGAGDLSPEQLEKITILVKAAVGFDAQRGDTISIVSAPFADSSPMPQWRQQAFLESLHWGIIGAVVVLALVLLARPLIRHLRPMPVRAWRAAKEDGLGHVRLEGAHGVLQADEKKLDRQLEIARTLVTEDPKRAVQVIKDWMKEEA